MGMIRRLAAAGFWKAALVLSKPPTKAEPRWFQVRSGPLRGLELHMDPRDGASSEMIEGIYDDFLFDALKKRNVLRDGAVVWDVGAHVGYDSMAFASLIGSGGRVCAFEPNPYNAERLRQHLARNLHLGGRVELHECAVASLDGELPFRLSPSHFLSSIGYLNLDDQYPSDRISGATYDQLQTVMVRVRTLDSLLNEGLLAPSLVKIDVEGSESQVLEGGHGLLTRIKPHLLIEVHSIKNMFLIQKMLLNCGYAAKFFDDPRHRSSSRGFVFAQ
jgi:FkbM family methyltransferase